SLPASERSGTRSQEFCQKTPSRRSASEPSRSRPGSGSLRRCRPPWLRQRPRLRPSRRGGRFPSDDVEAGTHLERRVTQHGKHGVLKLPKSGLGALAGYMGVDIAACVTTLRKLPNLALHLSDANVTVTWNNWERFQKDTTAAERMRRYRQRRGEENTSPLPL